MEEPTGVPRRHHEVARPPTCVVCAGPTHDVGTCCSASCAQQAAREVERNVAELRRLHGHDVPSETRRRLAERNGRLSSALLRWRPPDTIELSPLDVRHLQDA